MIQITSPVAASKKWPRISGGRIRLPGSRPWRMPPLESQIASKTKPPPAVTTHAISAAHFIPSLLGRIRRGVRTVQAVGLPRRAVAQSRPLGRSRPDRAIRVPDLPDEDSVPEERHL